MQTTTSTSKSKATNKGYDQLATGLRSAVDEFEKTASPENVDAIFSFLKPAAEMGQRALNGTIDYSRRHPIRIAITVAALGLVAARMLQKNSARA